MRKTIAALALAPVLATGIVRIPTPVEAATTCDLGPQIQELKDVQSSTELKQIQRLSQELEIRQSLLSRIIICDEEQIAALRSALDAMPKELKSQPAYERATRGLEEAAKYYETKKTSVPRLGLQATKDLSRELAAWRANTYVPLAKLADHFILWTDSQALLSRATERVTQAGRFSLALKLTAQDKEVAKFDEAGSKMKLAKEENDEALKALNEGRTEEGLAHIQGLLQALTDTYGLLVELRKTIPGISAIE